MSEQNWQSRTHEALRGAHENHRAARLWSIMAVAWVLIACCSPIVMWDGVKRTCHFESALVGMQKGPNQEAAVAEMHALVVRALREIRLHEQDEGRLGTLARNAAIDIGKEATK